MVKRYEIPPIPPGEATPRVKALVGVIEKLLEENQQQAEKLQHLRDEIATLKGEKAKPKLKPSNMDKEAGQKDAPDVVDEDQKKRPGSAKRNKTEHLTIHEERVIAPSEPLPPGARFKGYRDVIV